MGAVCHFNSCSRPSNSGVEKNSPRVVSRPSQIIFMVISFGFWLFPYRIFLILDGGSAEYAVASNQLKSRFDRR